MSLDEPALDEILRALSHAQRRQFVNACLVQERAAGELAELSHLALASVSEHLKVLRKCGLLILEVRGRYWMYRTDRQLLRTVLAALAQLEEKRHGS
jgi:DNA-binding transcriptional ArsR family regulator